MRNKEKARAKDKSRQYEKFVDEALKLLTTPEEVEKTKQQNNKRATINLSEDSRLSP